MHLPATLFVRCGWAASVCVEREGKENMRALHRGLLIVPLFAAFATAPAMAQSWKWDWGVNLGWSRYTASLDEEDTGLPDEAGGAEVHWDEGLIYGTQLTFWLRPKLGLRFNGRYSDRALEGSDIDQGNFVTSTNMWGATADLMFRFKAPAPEFTKFEMLPYLALGLGAKWHNGSEDNFTCNDGSNSFNCSPFVTGLPRPGTAPRAGQPRGWAFGEENAIAGLIGLGADWRLARSLALRTEINDQLFVPEFHRASAIPATGTATWNVSEDNDGGLTHELGAQIGLHFLFGVADVPVVAVAPPPPPPAAPPPAPEVRRESLTVCVIDPTAPGGIRMQTATLIEGRDTVISVGGTDRPFRESVGTVMVAQNANWYVQGQPLTMTVGKNRVEFTTYGSSRIVEASDLAFLGTVNGYPVYGDRDDVKDVIDELAELNRARAGTDLGQILEENRELRDELDDLKVLYVPMAATGCVFQAVQRQEEVRKGGK